MTFTEYVIRQEKVLARTIDEREVIVGESVANAMSANLVRRVPRLLSLKEWGPVGVAVMNNNTKYITVNLSKIPLLADYKKVGDILVPNFSTRGARARTQLPMEWTPPDGMKVKMLIQSLPSGETESVSVTWVFAADSRGGLYRLPLPNLHADCKLCSGQDNYFAADLIGVTESVLEQFRKSQWNADLWDTVEESQRMFRFKPNNEGFEQLPPEGDWTGLCKKVSVAVGHYLT